jgi:cytochrome c
MRNFILRLYRARGPSQKIPLRPGLRFHAAGTVLVTYEVQAMKITIQTAFASALIGACAIGFSSQALAVDVEAAKALAKQNNCLKCHSIDKDKDGPSYKKVAEKYKGKPTAEARLIDHIMSGEKAKFPDGHEEEHKIVKTSPPKDMEQIKNLVQWILSQ